MREPENPFDLNPSARPRLRVVHCIPSVSKESSGPSYSVTELCKGLSACGDDVTLVTLDWPGGNEGSEFVRKFPLGVGPRRLGISPAMRRWLIKTASTGRVDVLHSHGMWQFNALYPSWAAKRSNAKLVCSPRGAFSLYAMSHGSRLKRVFWPFLQRPAAAAASCFHATSNQEYMDIRRLGFRQPISVIPNGIHLPPLRPRVVAARRTLLFLGRVHPIKGLDVLLTAWAEVQGKCPEWQLTIAGSDEGYYGSTGYLAAMRRLSEHLRLDRVQFAGELRGDAKWQALRDADLFILPTRSENFGIAVAEALASATPAVVTHGAPWADIESERAGWWVPGTLDDLVACLEQALSCSRDELSEMGRRGREWMVRRFSWIQIATQMHETYEWIGNRATRPSCVVLD